MKIKRYDATNGWVLDYPEVSVSSIVVSNPLSASSTTFLRGDGQWAAPSATDSTKLPLTGGTLTGNLTVSAGTSGDAFVKIEADTDNNNENDNPYLQFNQDGGNTIANAGITGDAGTIFSSSLANAAYFGNEESASVQFYTNGSAKLTIREDGDVGIGTTSPTQKLDVSGSIRASSNMYAARYYDLNDTNYYVDPASHSVLNTVNVQRLEVEGAIFDSESSSLRMPMVKGGHYNNNNGTVTGAIEIVLPSGTYANATMLNFFVDVYDYAGGADGESFTLHIGGYIYSNGTWYNTFSNLISGRTDRFFNVRFNNDSTNNANIIYIAETTSAWNYPKVTIRDFSAGHSGASDADWYNNSFSIDITTTMSGTTNHNKSAENVASYALNADKLDNIQATSFLRSDATDTATGALTLSNTSNHYSGHHYFDAYDANGNHYPHYLNGSNNNGAQVNMRVYDSNGTAQVFYINGNSNDMTWRGNKIWNAGNDGPSSGLNADLLDNLEASAFLQKSGGTMTGDVVLQKDGTTDVGSHGIVFQANTTLDSLGDYTRELNIDSLGNLKFNGNNVATESYVGTQVANLVDSAPGTLNTLNELAAALGDDANFSTTVTDSIATKLPLTGGTLTGTLTTRAINTQNYNITNVGALQFNDPGPNEGISWSGGNFSIYESPNDLSTNSSGNLQFVSGGSRRLTVQTDGTVYAPGAIQSGDSVNTPELQMTSNGARNKIRVWSGGTYGMGMMSGFTYGGLGATGGEYAMTFQMNDDDDRGFWWGDSVHTTAQGAMALTTAGQLTVADKIRVGYGQSDTTTPANYALDANGDIQISNSNPVLRLNDTGTTTGDAYIDYQAGTSLKIHAGGDAITFIAGNSEKARITAGNGFLGIGTTNPQASLHIVETSAGVDLAKFRNDGDTGDVTIKTSGEVGIIKGGAGDQLQLSANGTDNNGIRITTAGNVGIGTTSPSEKLSVSGNISVTGTVDGVDIAALNTTVAGKLNATAAAAAITYVTSCPTSANSTGMKVYVGSTDCSTKYNGWLYLIT